MTGAKTVPLMVLCVTPLFGGCDWASQALSTGEQAAEARPAEAVPPDADAPTEAAAPPETKQLAEAKSPANEVVDARPAAAVPDDTPLHVVGLDLGSLASCARMSDGTVRCWGGNLQGQLGVGKDPATLLESYTPVQVAEIDGADALWFGASDCWSGRHSEGTSDTGCARIADGTVQCWGYNRGLMGNGESKGSDAPLTIASLANITALDSHCGTACAVFGDSSAKCWGSNASGAVGSGSEEREFKTPTAVQGLTNAAAVTCGQNHCCGLTTDGAVQCWGNGFSGQLGVDDVKQSNVPLPLAGLSDVKEIHAMSNTTCALRADASVACWGSDFGAPKPVEGAVEIEQFDAEGGMACGVRKDGSVRCWGRNEYGQLGDGTRVFRLRNAAPVEGLSDAVEVRVGGRHACARTKANAVLCWGSNSRGQLGDGTLEDRPTPVPVVRVDDAELSPQPAAERPTALPTDGERVSLQGAPKRCASDPKVTAKVRGQAIPFEIRRIEAEKNASGLGYEVTLWNYDVDEDRPDALPRGRQARIEFDLTKYVREPDPEGKGRLVQKQADKASPYSADGDQVYRTDVAIFDSHLEHSMYDGQIMVTHMDGKWVCGELDVRHADKAHALTGTFAAKVQEG